MKYEYLCGYESDFFAMPENVIAVVRLDHCVQGLTEFNQITECGKPVLAMRRIIKTPVWTVADQKAGKLPEVGAELAHKTQGLCEFIGRSIDDKTCWALKLKSGLIYIANKNWCSPIESPEEKAARLRDEWVDSAITETEKRKDTTTDEYERLKARVKDIYDALLSGDLPVPSKE